MTGSEAPPSELLEEVRRLAGPSASIAATVRLGGGQHAETWRVDTADPATSAVVRLFPAGDPAPREEERVLRALDGLGGLVPTLLGGDPDERRFGQPVSLISRLDGEPDITPADPEPWARELGRALAAVHAVPAERIADEFLAAYEAASGEAVGDARLWDIWAVARSEDSVETWGPNYLPFGRADLDARELRRRHATWTARLVRDGAD